MYGGLFGDLPNAKTSTKKDDAKASDNIQFEVSAPAAPNDPRSMGHDKKSTVLSGLGNAGTAMAFIPVAVRPRKRPKPSTKSKLSPQIQNNPSEVVVKTTNPPAMKNSDDVVTGDEQAIQECVAVAVSSEGGTNEEESTCVINEAQQVKQEELVAAAYKPRSIDAGGESVAMINQVHIKQDPFAPTLIENIHEVTYAHQQMRDEPELEDERLRKLHESVTDPYDPHIPNDLLAYLERKEIEQERLRLEREALETLERQHHLRQKLDEERQRVQASGRASDIIEHRTKVTLMSGGRGRGINNLPAWLLKKQQEELGSGPVDNIGKRTLVLSNLTAPGDIDIELGEEVQEECEEVCGPVECVQVKDAQPPHQPEVQVWVQFRNIDDAKKAATLFQGRLFGHRRITARQLSD